MKFEEGTNRFRVLPAKEGNQTLIMGLEYWKTVGEKRKPKRVSKDTIVPIGELEINPKNDELDTPKFFWAFAVWNYDAKAVQILELKQKTIRQAIEALSKNPKWGSPTGYDIVVNQVIENGKTSYSVTPDPKEEIEEEILKIYNSTPLDLNALFSSSENEYGGDPFANNEQISDEDLAAAGL